MSQRYATIIKRDDGHEIVSSIAQMEGDPPEVRSDEHNTYRVQKVADGVQIGMIKGGPVGSVGGFGFPEGTTPEQTEAKAKPAAKAKA